MKQKIKSIFSKRLINVLNINSINWKEVHLSIKMEKLIATSEVYCLDKKNKKINLDITGIDIFNLTLEENNQLRTLRFSTNDKWNLINYKIDSEEIITITLNWDHEFHNQSIAYNKLESEGLK